jgi:hypothetical protein
VKDGVLKTTIDPPAITGEDSAERAHIWLRANEAQEAGDEILARILLKAYGELENSSPSGGAKPTVIRSVSANPVLVSATTSPTEIEEEEDLIYAVGTVTSHQDIGFTPYFEENIRKLKAPLPLTIFDRGTEFAPNNTSTLIACANVLVLTTDIEWQKQALTAHLSVKPAKSSEDKAYRGLPFHSEWSQTHSRWTNNHRSFYLTLRDVYNKKKFAEKLLKHKENCDEIADEFGFMTAFRYDILVRSNAFAHRVPTKGGAAVPDISVKQSILTERCYNTARSAGETHWTDNYYAPGGSHAHIDPDTGREKLVRSQSYTPKVNDDLRHPVYYSGGGSGYSSNFNRGGFTGSSSYHNQGNFHQPNFNPHQHHQRRSGGFGSQGGDNVFHSGLPGGPSDSRKRSRGYQGGNFIDGFVDKRSVTQKGGQDDKSASNQGNK